MEPKDRRGRLKVSEGKVYRAHVHAGTPPKGLTLLQAAEWQRKDQERMQRELAEQREAIFELIDGAKVH